MWRYTVPQRRWGITPVKSACVTNIQVLCSALHLRVTFPANDKAWLSFVKLGRARLRSEYFWSRFNTKHEETFGSDQSKIAAQKLERKYRDVRIIHILCSQYVTVQNKYQQCCFYSYQKCYFIPEQCRLIMKFN